MDGNQLQYIKFQTQYAGRVEEIENCVVKAAKLTHAIANTAEERCALAWKAMKSGKLDDMRNIIQWYIHQYGQSWSRFKEVKFQYVDKHTYAQLSKADLIQQLHCIIILVYKDTSLNAVNKENFRECVKKQLKKSKVFTDKELDVIFT